MATTLFVMLGIFSAGYLGACAWAGRGRFWPLAFVICSSAFPAVCLLIGWVLGINAYKIMAATGLFVFGFLVFALFPRKSESKAK
ncbi:MAG: hypothetical protein JNM58_11100 [Xanthomonadaceae bacterium]|nr:hypothetical protein [Xanthomonadaceae bacterium]